MKHFPPKAIKHFLTLLIMVTPYLVQAQSSRIDWSRDTVSKSDAIGGRDTYVNTIRGSGQLATEKITLPVEKMKEIFDACYANNITEITVLFVAIRQSDLARIRKNNPEIAGTNSQLKGRQMLVFKVPRRAFASNSATGNIEVPGNHPLMLSLAAMGLVQVSSSLLDVAATGDDIYFSIGTICPPPASCDL